LVVLPQHSGGLGAVGRLTFRPVSGCGRLVPTS
jgi:hypothetical protein